MTVALAAPYIAAAVVVYVVTLAKNRDAYHHFSDVLFVGVLGFFGACAWPATVFFWIVWRTLGDA